MLPFQNRPLPDYTIIPSYRYAENSKLISQRNRDMCLQRCTTAKANSKNIVFNNKIKYRVVKCPRRIRNGFKFK